MKNAAKQKVLLKNTKILKSNYGNPSNAAQAEVVQSFLDDYMKSMKKNNG